MIFKKMVACFQVSGEIRLFDKPTPHLKSWIRSKQIGRPKDFVFNSLETYDEMLGFSNLSNGQMRQPIASVSDVRRQIFLD